MNNTTATRVQMIEERKATQSWGAVWTMQLEKLFSASGKTASYMIYAHGGQSYPVGEFRSLKAARKVLDSFSEYKAVA